MTRRQALAMAGFCLGSGSACLARKPLPVSFSEINRSYKPEDYDEVLERWTRHGKLVRDIGTVFEMWVIYKSWDYRQAFIEQYVSAYRLGDDRRRELRAAELAASRAAHQFVVIAQSTDYRWNDLEEAESPWRVSLLDGRGGSMPPTALEVEKLPKLFEMRFYPRTTDFSKTYTLTFARTGPEADAAFAGPPTAGLTLRVAGPLGMAETTWKS